jgi:CheY-like chemotaxis protein
LIIRLFPKKVIEIYFSKEKIMLNLFVIDWNEEELYENIEPLLKEGWNVGYEYNDEIYAKVNIESLKPDIIIIYLNTSPSKGRNAAHLIKKEESIKDIPIVFVDGKAKDIKKAKKEHPNAIYTTSDSLNTVLLNLQN